MSKTDHEPDDDYLDDYYEKEPDENCPKCGRFYDDADFDFQICLHCGFDNNELKPLTKSNAQILFELPDHAGTGMEGHYNDEQMFSAMKSARESEVKRIREIISNRHLLNEHGVIKNSIDLVSELLNEIK